MTWGVRFLQEARGRDYETAVHALATVPLGWMIGCPLLGFVSDRLGRRKPVILGGALVLLGVLAWVLFGTRRSFAARSCSPHGHRFGAAMLPYTVIKEANPPELGGSATGVINFINFTFSALLGPVFAGLLRTASESAIHDDRPLPGGFLPLLYGVALRWCSRSC